MSDENELVEIKISRRALKALVDIADGAQAFLNNQERNDGAVFAEDLEVMRSLSNNVIKLAKHVFDSNMAMVPELLPKELVDDLAERVEVITKALEKRYGKSLEELMGSHNCDDCDDRGKCPLEASFRAVRMVQSREQQ